MTFVRRCIAFPLILLFGLVANSQAQVVISQVYGGGGNSGAVYRSDFIELFNRGTTTVSLSGWSVQYASATGTSWQRTNLSGNIAPGQYFLVKQADGTNASALALPTPDAIGTIPMSGTAGKVLLVNSITSFAVACPSDAGIQDFVGFGSANCSETAPTPALSNTTAAKRAGNGCTDSNNNSADFSTGAAAPRNSASSGNSCAGVSLPNLTINNVSVIEGDAGAVLQTFTVALNAPAGASGVTFDIATADNTATVGNNDYQARTLVSQTIPEGSSSYTFDVIVNGDSTIEGNESYFVNVSNVVGANLVDGQGLGTISTDDFLITPIHDIQGATDQSPLPNGTVVTTLGIVTALRSSGFFIQTPDAAADANPATSQAVFVFTNTSPATLVQVGQYVRVSGSVVEYRPANSAQLFLTEISNPIIAVLSTGNPLPTAITLDASLANADSNLDSLERFESMRVKVSLTVVAPSSGNISEPNATSSTDGVFYGVLPEVARPFREPGISRLDTYPTPSGVPVWDSNPERIRVQSGGQLNALRLSVSVGDSITDATGVLDYGFGAYTFIPDPAPALNINYLAAPTAVNTAASDEYTVSGFNLLRFFDNVNDPATGEPVLTASALNNRLGKTANAICEFVKTPDILGVVEVENLSVLQQLADTINNGAVAGGVSVPACNASPAYQAFLLEGNDVGGIDVGFLISKRALASGVERVEALSLTQIGKDTLFTNANGSTELLNDRPTLVLEARIHHDNGASSDVTIMINHLRSLIGVNDTAAGSLGWATVGERVRAKRLQQAKYLADVIHARQSANPNEKIILLGDFNAFEFNDGYVDSMGIITGREAAEGEVVNYYDSPITTPLTNMADLSAADERYSFSFDGSAQSLDHAVVNQALLDSADSVHAEHARINADFAEILFGQFGQDANGTYTIPVRVSDHDPVVLFVKNASFRTVDLAVSISAAAQTPVNSQVVYIASVGNAGPDVAEQSQMHFTLSETLSDMNVQAPSGWICTSASVTGTQTQISCTNEGLETGYAADFIISAAAGDSEGGANIALTVTANSINTDSAPANNSAVASIHVVANADLSVKINGNPGKVKVGHHISLPIIFNNNGPDNAYRPYLAVSTNAPSSSFTLQAPSGWSCAVSSSTEHLCKPDADIVAPATELTFKALFAAPASMANSNLIVGVGVSADTPDPQQNNNEDSHASFVQSR